MRPTASSLTAGVRRNLVTGVALVLVGLPTPALAQAQQSIDIPARPAAEALIQLCLTAGCELAVVGSVQARSRPVQGRMSWRTAVGRMLDGTGLQYRFIGERGLRVWAGLPPSAPAAPRAPDAPSRTVLDEVVVVGRLSSQIDAALRAKRTADVISDSVTADRIGDLPAANLAEALQRMPGVAIEREVGEGQFVSVRGLGPLFQSVTLNGAPVAFNENIRNSTQSGRQFRFRALSPDLLAGARLTKSATPDLVEGGIGSNIDIQTVGGLDGDAFLTLRAGATVEARTGQFRPEISMAGRHVSQDGRWGVVAGASEEARSVTYDRFQMQRYRDMVIDGQAVSAPNDVRTTVEQEDRRRRSAFVGGDARLSDGLSVDLDLLVSTFDNAIREDRLVYGLGERLLTPGSVVTVRDGVVTGARVTGGRIDNNTEVSDQNHLNIVASAGAEARWGEWRLTPRISASLARSVLDTPLERISSWSPEGVGYVFDRGAATDARRVEVLETDFDVTDPAALLLRKLAVRAIRSEDDDVTGLIDARRPLDHEIGGLRLSMLRVGLQVSDRGRDYERRDREATMRPGWTAGPDIYGAMTPDDVFAELVRQGVRPWVAVDFARIRDGFFLPGEADGIIVSPGDLAPTGADLQNSYRVGERVAAAYARFDFDGEAGGVPFFGNIGLRAVQTTTRVEGALLGLDGGGQAAVRPVEWSGDHTAVLPSLNVAFDLDNRQILRLAVSRTLTRPSLADLRAATVPASTLVSSIYDRGQAEIDDPSPGSIFNGVGGNPALKPYLSTNLDLSWEWTAPRSAVSVALFHKRIDDFVRMVAAPEVLTFETRAGPPVQAEVLMSRPQNSGRAEVTGLELGLHHRLVGGFGVWASATLTDSRVGPDGASLTGVSDVSWSISPFFESGPLAVNLSWSWRSAFRSEADMQGGGVSAFTVAPAGYLDAQATLDLTSNVQMVVSASNLTDTVDRAWEDRPEKLLQLGRVGRSMALGLRWSF